MVLPNPLLSGICDSIIHEELSWDLTVCKLLVNLHKGIGQMCMQGSALVFVCVCVCVCVCVHVHVCVCACVRVF